MTQNHYISLREWFVKVWQKQGKTIDELAVEAGFDMGALQSHLDRRVSTLKEWWELMGNYLYKDYQAFADDLNILVPVQRPIKKSSISDWFTGRRSPAFVEWRQALYAFTALPIYRTEEQPVVSFQQTPSEVIEVFQALTLMQKFSVEFLKELSAIWSKNLSDADRARIKALVREHLQKLHDIGEDRRAVEEIEKLFS